MQQIRAHASCGIKNRLTVLFYFRFLTRSGRMARLNNSFIDQIMSKDSSSKGKSGSLDPRAARQRARDKMFSHEEVLEQTVKEMDAFRKEEGMSKTGWAEESEITRTFLARICSHVPADISHRTLSKMAEGVGRYLCYFQ